MTSEELKTRLEITINAHTSYSNKFNIDFLPSMIRNSGASSSGSGRSGAYPGYDYEYRDGLRASGVNRRMVYLPTTHLIDEVFPKFEKRYRIPATVLFTNTAKYMGYIKYANSILYDEDGRENTKFIHSDSNIMITRNIKFILKELFVKNRILVNVNTISGLDLGLGSGIGNGNGNGNKQLNQEYYIESVAQPVADNGKIFKEGDVEIERLKAKEDAIRSEINIERKKLETMSDDTEKRKIKFNIVRKEKQIGVSIQKRTEYKYGEVTTNLKTLIKNRERYAGIVENSSSSSGSSGRMGSTDSADTYRTYKQKLKETESAIKAMEIDTYIVTIPDMSLIPSLLDNGKDNPQFKLLIKKMSEIDIGTDRVKSSSMFGVPSKAQCASDKREIERMFDEILNAARKQVLQKDNNSAPSPPAHSGHAEDSNYLQKMKEAYANVMDKTGSAEFFNNVSTKKQLAKMSRTYTGTVKTPGDNETNETPIAILCRTRMGKFLALFTLFESDTLKLHRPNIASSSMVHIDVVPIKGLDGSGGVKEVKEVNEVKEVKEGGQERAVGVFKVDKMPLDIKVTNAELIFNLNANIPPAYFRMSGDYRAYNEYKTRNIVYKKFDFFDFRLDSPIDVKNYEAALKIVMGLIKNIRAEIETYKSLPVPEKQFEFAVKLESMSSLVRAIKHLTNNGPTTDKRHFAITALRIAERIEERGKELSKWLLQKKEYDDHRSKIIAKYRPTNAVAFNKHMKGEHVLDDDYKTKPFDDSYYEARAAIDQTFFDSMNIPVNALTQIAVSIPKSDAMIVKIKAARDYANRIRETTSKIVYAFAHTTAEKIDDKSTELLHDVNDLSTKAKDEIIGAATALNLRAQKLFDEIGNALTNLLSIRGIVYGIPLILANSAEMAILAAGGVVTVAAGAGTLAISIASVMAAVAATSASYSAILGLIAAYEVAEKSLIAVGGIILTSGAIAALSVTLMIDAFNIVGRTFKKIKDWLSNKIIEIKNWWRNRDLVKIIENGQKIIPRLGDIEAFNAELIGDKVVDDVVVANHKRDAIIASAEYSKLLTSSDKDAKDTAYKTKMDADTLVAADEANAPKYAFKQIENAFEKFTPIAAATAATAASATSKKSESKFDDVELLKRIIEDVEESDEGNPDEVNDEVEDNENAVKNLKIVTTDTSLKIPPLPALANSIGDKVETKLTSAEIGKKIAVKMKEKGITFETDSSRGLTNHGNTCYMNAALQLIFSMTKVKDEIIGKTFSEDEVGLVSLNQYMKKMSGEEIENTIELAEDLFSIATSLNNIHVQQDSHELLNAILDKAYDAFKDPKVIELDTKITGLSQEISKLTEDDQKKEKTKELRELEQKRETLKPEENHPLGLKLLSMDYSVVDKDNDATNCRKRIQNKLPEQLERFKIIKGQPNADQLVYASKPIYELMAAIPVPNVGSFTFGKLYDNHLNTGVKPEKAFIQNNITNICSSLNANTIVNKMFIKPGKNYLIFHLKRFEFVNDNVTNRIDTNIDIENSEIPANDGTPDVFRILGCICHYGKTPKSGHYTYASFKGGKPDIYYNDSAVSNLDVDTDTKDGLKKACYVLLFERVTKAKAGGARETKRCRLNLNSNNRKYTRRHNKNKNRAATTVTVIKH